MCKGWLTLQFSSWESEDGCLSQTEGPTKPGFFLCLRLQEHFHIFRENILLGLVQILI